MVSRVFFLISFFIMVQLSKFIAVAAACLAAPAVAHPGEKHDPHVVKRELHARDYAAAAAKRSLAGCENSLHARELAKRNVARRSQKVQNLRKKRGVTARMEFLLYLRHGCTADLFIQTLRNGVVIWPLSRSGRLSTTTRPVFSTIALPLPSLSSLPPTPAAS